MKQYWNEGELIEFWTLTDVERQFSDQRTQRGRLGLAHRYGLKRPEAAHRHR